MRWKLRRSLGVRSGLGRAFKVARSEVCDWRETWGLGHWSRSIVEICWMTAVAGSVQVVHLVNIWAV